MFGSKPDLTASIASTVVKNAPGMMTVEGDGNAIIWL